MDRFAEDQGLVGPSEGDSAGGEGEGPPARRIPFTLVFTAGVVVILGVSLVAQSRPPPAVELAVKKAGADARVASELGAPLEVEWSPSFLTSCGGDVYLRDAVPIRGPKKPGTLYVQATRVRGRWQFTTLSVQPQDSPLRIDVLRPPPLKPRGRPVRPGVRP